MAAQQPTRLPSLTGGRAIAAFLVFLSHATYTFVFADAGVQSGFLRVGEHLGSMGVVFFFVLSGFVLTWAARPSISARRFWGGRVVRIFPAHLVVFAVAFALVLASGVPVQAAEVAANLFLVHGFVPDTGLVTQPINDPTWSLSPELLFYGLFPLLILPVRRLRPERLWWWLLGAVGLALAMPLVAAALPGGPADAGLRGMSRTEMWFTYFFPGARLAEFLVGMVLARLVLEGRWIRLGVTPAALLLVAGYAGSLWAPPGYRSAAAYVVPVALLVGALATADVRGRPGFLAHRPMVFLGEISYAFFLVHLVVLKTARGAVDGVWSGYGGVYPSQGWSTPVGVLFLLGGLVVALGLAWVLHRTVELPAMRAWARRSRPPAPVVPITGRPDSARRAA